jgi:hypothetical protein
MSSQETEFNMNIFKATADTMDWEGRASQEKHTQGPASESLGDYKIPGPKKGVSIEKGVDEMCYPGRNLLSRMNCTRTQRIPVTSTGSFSATNLFSKV